MGDALKDCINGCQARTDWRYPAICLLKRHQTDRLNACRLTWGNCERLALSCGATQPTKKDGVTMRAPNQSPNLSTVAAPRKRANDEKVEKANKNASSLLLQYSGQGAATAPARSKPHISPFSRCSSFASSTEHLRTSSARRSRLRRDTVYSRLARGAALHRRVRH